MFTKSPKPASREKGKSMGGAARETRNRRKYISESQRGLRQRQIASIEAGGGQIFPLREEKVPVHKPRTKVQDLYWTGPMGEGGIQTGVVETIL